MKDDVLVEISISAWDGKNWFKNESETFVLTKEELKKMWADITNTRKRKESESLWDCLWLNEDCRCCPHFRKPIKRKNQPT